MTSHGQGFGPIAGSVTNTEIKLSLQITQDELREVRRILEYVKGSPVIRFLLWIDKCFGRKY